MDKAEVEEKVLDILEDVCGDDIVRDERDMDLFAAGLLDSMGGIEVLVRLQDELGVEIAPTAVERSEMNSVNTIIHQVEIRL